VKLHHGTPVPQQQKPPKTGWKKNTNLTKEGEKPQKLNIGKKDWPHFSIESTLSKPSWISNVSFSGVLTKTRHRY